MPALAVVGMQWGDEGKGKITDLFAEKSDYVVRFHGGSNAGHTVEVNGVAFKFHQIPSGILHRRTTAVIANGTVVDAEQLISEMDALEQQGYSTSRLWISDRAQLVMPYHRALDGAEERLRGAGAIGTTKRGIGPCYADKAARNGFRVGELLWDEGRLLEKLKFTVAVKNAYANALSESMQLSAEELLKNMLKWRERLAPHITDTAYMLNAALAKGKNVLFEGAHGILLDIDHGNYPFVTSSNTVPGNIYTGAGINTQQRVKVLGVVKAYATRVGAGPFPTELQDETGQHLAEKGAEFGTTTGRKRRCGWLDLFAVKYCDMLSGTSSIALTKLDVLSGLSSIRVATGYRLKGKLLKHYPHDALLLSECVPVYKEMKGWEEDITGITKYRDLPTNAVRYIEFIEKYLGKPVSVVSTGQSRSSTIVRKGIL